MMTSWVRKHAHAAAALACFAEAAVLAAIGAGPGWVALVLAAGAANVVLAWWT